MSLTGNVNNTNLKVLRGKIKSLSPYSLDKTLTIEDAAADAKATGDAIAKARKDSKDYVDESVPWTAVLYSKQALTASQQEQARTNIGAALNGDNGFSPDTENELQELLDTGKPVLVTKPINLSKTIVIDKDNARLEFVEGVEFDFAGKGFPAFQIGSEANPKPIYVSVKNVRVRGDKTKGSVGIYLFGAGYAYEIISPRIFGCEYGIKTREEDVVLPNEKTAEHFDCAQQGCIFEPYLGGAKVGLMDAGGGLQNTRIFGGRIEQNSEWGIVTASPNVCFTGSLIQGNVFGEVKLLNTTGLGSIRASGGTFDNCYYEHIKRQDIVDAIFQFGDESQNDGWFGNLNLIGCKFYNYQDDVVARCNGNALPSGSSIKTIHVIGCHMNGKQLFSLPNVDFGCKVLVTGLSNTAGAKLPTEGVNEKANVQFVHSNYSKFGYVKADGIMGTGDFTPMNYAYTKDIRTEPFIYNHNDDGSYTPIDRAGYWISRTASELLPWNDPNVGVMVGTMHYCTKFYPDYPTPCWFQRVGNKNDADDETKWGSIVYGDAKGVADYLHANSVRVEPDGNFGQWLEITKSENLPWEDENTGVGKGSLHYCSAVISGYPTPCWFERIGEKLDADGEAKWNVLVRANANGIAANTYTHEIRLEAVGQRGSWLEITKSANLPWNDSNVGINPGSLHYCSGAHSGYGLPAWYIRTTGKGGTDSEAKWNRLVYANPNGIAAGTHTHALQLEADGQSGNWSQFTKSQNLPWNEPKAGAVHGSMHYCMANQIWYVRVAGAESTGDTSANWRKIAMEAAE